MWKALVGVTLLFLADNVVCKPDYLFNEKANGWFKLHAVPATWQQAFLSCRYEGAVLASPINEEVATALRNITIESKLDSPIFLGVNSFVKGVFVSIEGVPVADLSITWGSYGDGKTPDDCLTLSTNGKTYISSCTLSLPYICYKQRDNTTVHNRCGTFDDGKCFEGNTSYQYSTVTGSCYKYHPIRQSWNKGYTVCAAEGGHLVILNDKREVDIVHPLLTLNAMHIGLRDWNNDSTWLSIHGDKIENLYNSWYSGYPTTPYASYPCAIMLSQRTFQNEFCDHISQHWYPFVCEKDPKSLRFEKISQAVYEAGTEATLHTSSN